MRNLTSTTTKMSKMLTALTSDGSSFFTSGSIPIKAQLVMTAMMLITSKATFNKVYRVSEMDSHKDKIN